MTKLPEVSHGVYFHDARDMRLGSQPVPQVRDNEVLIKVKYSGICGSDMHFYRNGSFNDRPFKKPVVMGHEPVGTIVAVGSAVTNVKVGDRVAVEPNINCGKCEYCKVGHSSLCTNCGEIPPRHGFNQQYVVHLAELCHPLADSVSFEDASVTEPLSCCLNAVTRCKVNANSIVLINGAGPMGLLMAFSAKAFGASFVIITDINKSRLEHAVSIGAADAMFIVDVKESLSCATERLSRVLPLNKKVNVSIDCICVESSVALALEVTKAGGTVGLVGLTSKTVKMDVLNIICKELTIVGSNKTSNEFPLALDLLSRGLFTPSKVVSHIIEFHDYQRAFDLMDSGEGMKILLSFD